MAQGTGRRRAVRARVRARGVPPVKGTVRKRPYRPSVLDRRETVIVPPRRRVSPVVPARRRRR